MEIIYQIMTEQTDPILVDNVSITSATGLSSLVWLDEGDSVSVTATFSESVIVDNASGTPTLNIVVDTAGDGADVADNRTATYVSGSTSTALVFQYTIQAGDNDTNGISIGANALALNGSTIRDASGNYATITHSPVDNNTGYKVDTADPTVISVAMSGLAGDYFPGHTFSVTATFSESVIVDNASGIDGPKLTIEIIEIGLATQYRPATYQSGSGSTALIFQYKTNADTDNEDRNGISIGVNALALNSGTIKDLAGHDATITHSAVASNSLYKTK